ncbi:MAG: hypothetical protein GXP49_08350 [Deltaproteobacteria bacterium]|nr:hypothetical protein [Deltaproteobacteria bacterium]
MKTLCNVRFLFLVLLTQFLMHGCVLFSISKKEQGFSLGQKQVKLPDSPKELLKLAGKKADTGLNSDARIVLKAVHKARKYGASGPKSDILELKALSWLALYGRNNEKHDAARRAYKIAELFMRKNPKKVQGYYYTAINLGLLVQSDPSEGISRLPDIIFALKKAVELDETFFHAAPRRALGAVFLKAPSYPSGPGDLDAALENLEKAVALAPRWPENWLYLAEAKLEDDSLKDAVHCAKQVLFFARDMIGEAASVWRSKARSLLRRIREKLHRSREFGL